MTQISIDNYFDKLNEIVNACNTNLTQESQLSTLLSELNIISDILDTELNDEANFPTTLIHLRKIILLEIERERKSTFHNALLNLKNVMEDYSKTLPIVYGQENNNNISSMYTLIDETINNCSCMSSRKNIIKKTLFK